MAKIIELLIQNSKVLKSIFFIILLLVIVFDFYVKREEILFWGDNITCFWSIFGFILSTLIVSITKSLKQIFSKKIVEIGEIDE